MNVSEKTKGILRVVANRSKDNKTIVMDQNTQFEDITAEEQEEAYVECLEEEFDWVIHDCWFIQDEKPLFYHTPFDSIKMDLEEFKERFSGNEQ